MQWISPALQASRRQLLNAVFVAASLASVPAAFAAEVKVSGTLRVDQPGAQVSRQLFGQFAEHLGTGIYGGVWVGEQSPIPNTRGYRNDVVAALKAIAVPNIRWPGGCFADEYHWRDGVGTPAKRPIRVNTHWGGVEESNRFGTHEFMDFTELLGTQAYVAGNVGDAAPEEIAQWTEYMTAPTRSSLANERRTNGRDAPWQVSYFGVGNELWGCGGNMRVEYAADVFRRYQTFVKSPANQKILKIAPGPSDDDYHWTEVMMREATKFMDGLSMHYYTIPGGWPPRASSTTFDEAGWIQTLSRTLVMDELITKHSAIMDKYDPAKKVALVVDEWGTWYAPLPGTNPGFLQQQNSLRDALVASLNFDIFSQHAERVRMANIAQMVNVLQAMILTDGDKMVLTPTYHVFALYKPYQDATQLPLQLQTPQYRHGDTQVPAVHGSAVKAKDGHVYLALTNLDATAAATVSVQVEGLPLRAVEGQILTAPAITTYNTYAQPTAVAPATFNGARVQGKAVNVALPAHSIVMLKLQ
ncbi:alpha-N-arabinofuranosidase [Xanthomonas campestris pv. passiflorae]|uniref:alpha-N-arabinofuranosidase n=1 Tax=Xanthomonas campestris TaxID=339 RepID=UPI0024259255|nr:alpha-L-arabinofuranosidase C-terminal domain-containing protein [Xanthomonas campestris]MBV6812489.1 alpha-N-arabinofuranosidase [Xanthomonas campestris pv. passiflorae]